MVSNSATPINERPNSTTSEKDVSFYFKPADQRDQRAVLAYYAARGLIPQWADSLDVDVLVRRKDITPLRRQLNQLEVDFDELVAKLRARKGI